MRPGFAAGALVVMLWSSASAAQTPPVMSTADLAAFQGTWVLDLVRSRLADTAAERRVVTTDATSMRVEVHRPRDARPFTLVYNFDGSPTVNPFGDGTATSKLRREGPGFLTETVYTVNNQPITVREWLPPAPAGVELAIEVMGRLEHGYQGVPPALEAGAPNASKAIKYFQKRP